VAQRTDKAKTGIKVQSVPTRDVLGVAAGRKIAIIAISTPPEKTSHDADYPNANGQTVDYQYNTQLPIARPNVAILY
jgi:ribosomal protein L7Ae-like RNA K-turn-binding protein